MKCQVCGNHEATVLYTHVAENVKKSVYMCDECVAAHRVKDAPRSAAGGGTSTAKTKVAIKAPHAEGRKSSDSCCSSCGLTFDDFRKHGRFGCHACYESFAEELERLLKRIHGADQHQGKGFVKRQHRHAGTAGLEELQQALAQAVADEEYERAAQLRDQIRALRETAGVRPHVDEDSGDGGR